MSRVKTQHLGEFNFRVLLDGIDLGGRWKSASNAELAGKQVLTAVRMCERNRTMSVIATDKNGNELSFKSQHEANRITGVDTSGISKALRGIQGSAGGYTWRQQ